MTTKTCSGQRPLSPATGSSVMATRSRHDSVDSLSASSAIEKEQVAQAIAKIHISASQADVLTTFNDLAPPPERLADVENKSSAGELVQQGLSGLYSRFREAVGVGKAFTQEVADDADTVDGNRKKAACGMATGMASSSSSATRGEAGVSGPTGHAHLSSEAMASGTVSSGPATAECQPPASSKASSVATMATGKSNSSSTRNLTKLAKPVTTAAVANPAFVPVTVNAYKDRDPVHGPTSRADEPVSRPGGRKSMGKASEVGAAAQLSIHSSIDSALGDRLPRPWRGDGMSIDSSIDSPPSPMRAESEKRARSACSRVRSSDATRRPALMDRMSYSGNSNRSRSSSMEPGVAETSTINTSAHNSVYHDSFAHNERPQKLASGAMRIPGTTTNEGAPELVNARLEMMRQQVLSKEFWMADDTCKECFLCGDAFSAFRRKHHCRTCGCIFDAKCTSIISGQKFGVPGSLRVCKTCLGVINRRYESGSDESADESYLPAICRPKQTTTAARPAAGEPSMAARPEKPGDDRRTGATPMMAIPATRRPGDEANRNAAVLEIDMRQLSRPSSSRSLGSLASIRPQSAGHRRPQSKHNVLGRCKAPADERAPFRRAVGEEMSREAKLPAFHDDNIIDPDLAPYVSDESSGDEQMSILDTMSSDLQPGSLDPERCSFGPLLSAGRKHRFRPAEKSLSGLSLASRGHEEGGGAANATLHGRPGRRRNMSTASASMHHLRSPRPRSGIFKGADTAAVADMAGGGAPGTAERVRETEARRALNATSMGHVQRLFRQLLEEAKIGNQTAWERTLLPILMRCSDDVAPRIRHGDDMDIRHFVKLKRIPGGRPGDTAYVGGIVFTKNVALKSMPRSIGGDPKICIVSFPLEYQRHPEQHFMSLQPVIEQEKEFLRMVVNRIINLRPQVLLVQKGVSGVALQFLAEAHIAVVYNVKASVIEAVSRITKADIISSLDMLALHTSANVGYSKGFEVKTFVNNEIPGRKKTYIFVSAHSRELGCTINLRGASSAVLRRMKTITEFMVYVVYNLKLETSLMQNERLRPSSRADGGAGAEAGHAAPDAAGEAASAAGPKLVAPPTFYSDTVAKHQQRILSASPIVCFAQPYLLMKAREQEGRLSHLRRLRDQDVAEHGERPHQFRLITPEMVHETGQQAPRQIMEVLHAVYDAEYDKALHSYQTQTKQWEQYIQGSLDLFHPYSHQHIAVLHSVVCTASKIPCSEPQLMRIEFYNEHADEGGVYEPDCTLGQYVEELCDSAGATCPSAGCHSPMWQHHRSYVHADARITIFVERDAPVPVLASDGPAAKETEITMWTWCKHCDKDFGGFGMSELAWKYSFGKYLELSFWSSGLGLDPSTGCPHNHQTDHLRYFHCRGNTVRLHHDPIELYEVIVPRARITWKVELDLRLKNDIFGRMQERWTRLVDSIKARLRSIRLDSVLPEKADRCKAELERLMKKLHDDQPRLLRCLQDAYMNSKYYEVIPLNRFIGAMLEYTAEWETAFAAFETDFFSDRDARQLTMSQLRKIFTDNESTPSLAALAPEPDDKTRAAAPEKAGPQGEPPPGKPVAVDLMPPPSPPLAARHGPGALPEQAFDAPAKVREVPPPPALAELSLTDKIEKLRRQQQPVMPSDPASDGLGPDRAAPLSRRTGPGTLPRMQSSIGRLVKDAKGPHEDADKKLADRIGLSALQPQRKLGASAIPRYVHPARKESNVSSLARHFEQLSREFEKERIRDRNKRVAQMLQHRALLPRTSTKAIVEVFDDVDQAVREPGPSDDDHVQERRDRLGPAQTTRAHDQAKPKAPLSSEPPSRQSQADETTDSDHRRESLIGSDDEAGSDVDPPSLTLEDVLGDVQEIAASLEPSGEMAEELPKHQKKSVMNILSTFWAERSTSNWPQLDYPLKPTEHIFTDSGVIVREDEPSSLIALALSSEDYMAKLAGLRGATNRSTADEAELENCLLQQEGLTHLKYQYTEGAAKMLCKIFYVEQFDALRQKCGAAGRIIESLSRCVKWDSKGGKTKSVFLKTLDERLVMKSLSPVETAAFLKFAPAYFRIMAEAFFRDLPTVIAKMLGFFQVIIKNPLTSTEIKLDLLVMENLFYDRTPSRMFDLKGSMRNRKIQSTGDQNEVLLDENMVEYIYESPLFAREHSKRLLRASVWNDTLFLARQNVMDYSLMVAVDEGAKELVVGIIDCIRTYTWDKRLESWIKDRGFAGGGRSRPTVTSPKEYKSRFREAMARYILEAPTCWHQNWSKEEQKQSKLPNARSRPATEPI